MRLMLLWLLRKRYDLRMWSAWLIVIYTITCLLVIGIIAIGVWFVRVDMQRSKMISEKYVDTSKATDV
ncbi:hypothetical protein RB195_016388 [Necator americanus]|uniref:Uncharacterized protein n=2 Tax=Ancylostomatidae TaxID=33278 RepID=A0ABR1E8X8_NECAM